MLNQLFNSKTRVKILSLFFKNKNSNFYTQKIIKLAETDPANTHRELKKLVQLSILNTKKTNLKKYYNLNKSSIYFSSLEKLFDAYHRDQENKKPQWFLFEDFPNGFPVLVADFLNVNRSNKYLKSAGFKKRISETLAEYINGHVYLYFIKEEFDDISHEVIDTIQNKPESILKINQDCINKSNKLIKESRKLIHLNFSSLNSRELYNIFKSAFNAFEEAHITGWAQNASDFGKNLLSKLLINYLKVQISNFGFEKKYSVNDIFVKLTTPTEESNAQNEYKDLLEIYSAIYKNKKLKEYFKKTDTGIINENLKDINYEIDKKIQKHTFKYGYLGYNYIGPAWNKEYFIDIIASLARQNKNPKNLQEKIIIDKIKTKKIQEKLIKDLQIDKKYQEIFEIARGFVFTKGLRKDAMFFFFWAFERLLTEISKRYYLSFQQIRFLYPNEFKDLILNSKFDANALNQRFKYSINYSQKGNDYKNDIILTAEKARKFKNSFLIIEEKISNVKQLNGDTASPGKVRGISKIINVLSDVEKMEEGNILISIVTSPELVPAMKKAAAIITDVGGITSHAAIISRELGIPCVIGTKFATKIIKDGFLVDVDATHGKVTIIKRSS